MVQVFKNRYTSIIVNEFGNYRIVNCKRLADVVCASGKSNYLFVYYNMTDL